MSDERRPYQIRLTEEQFKLLWNHFPDDPALIETACWEEAMRVRIPNPTGYTQSGIPVYQDNGHMGSGYVLVHWDAAKSVPWCQDNGYYERLPPEEEPIVWDVNPEIEQMREVQGLLYEWGRPSR